MRIAIRTFLVLAIVTTAASAQCSNLAVNVTASSVDFSVTGAPADALTVVLISPDSGSTSIGPLMIDLGVPAIPIAIGSADANGDFSASFGLPPIPAGTLGALDFYSQAVSVEFGIPTGPPTGGGLSLFSFCTSNVVMSTVNL